MTQDDRLIDIPAVVLAVGGSSSVTELSGVAEKLKQNLLDIPGISRIDLEGDADEQITLALDDAALYRLGVAPKRILDTLPGVTRPSPAALWWWKASGCRCFPTPSCRYRSYPRHAD